MASFRGVTSPSPTLADAYLNLAILLQEQGRLREALAAFQGYVQHGENEAKIVQVKQVVVWLLNQLERMED